MLKIFNRWRIRRILKHSYFVVFGTGESTKFGLHGGKEL